MAQRDYEEWVLGQLAEQGLGNLDPYSGAAAGPPGALADQAVYSPWERSAAAVRFAAKPLAGRQGDPDRIANIASAPLRAAAGFTKAAFDRAAEEHGGVSQLSTDYDPRRTSAELGAETATGIVGTPAFTGGVPAGALGMAAGRRPPKEPIAGFAPGGILGIHPTSTAQAIHDATMKGGYSVNLPTGNIPKEGLMVGKYRNTDPRNLVVSKAEFTPADVERHVATNTRELSKPETYLGGWMSPEDKAYLDVSQRFAPDKIRVATKSGERTGQLAGYNVGAGAEFPIGNWRSFVGSPEFRGRMDEMAGVGREYLSQYPSKEWWDMHGSSFERAYGPKNLPQVAGFSAATAPVSNPYDNMRAMSEYMRRHIKGEPTIQPGFRIAEGGMGPWSAGKQIPLEQSRIANLEKAAAGNLDALQRAKVREEAKAMSGDPSAVVLDRHWARITEDPSRGIFANAQEGVIDTAARKKGVGDYDYVKSHVSDAAHAANRDPRDYSADVWTGIRETIKRTNQLFGTPHKGSAILGESKSYADIFQELLEKKAKHLKISVREMDERLRSGDADLLSTVLATPALFGAYQAWQAGQDNNNKEPPVGSLADQSGYQRM